MLSNSAAYDRESVAQNVPAALLEHQSRLANRMRPSRSMADPRGYRHRSSHPPLEWVFTISDMAHLYRLNTSSVGREFFGGTIARPKADRAVQPLFEFSSN